MTNRELAGLASMADQIPGVGWDPRGQLDSVRFLSEPDVSTGHAQLKPLQAA